VKTKFNFLWIDDNPKKIQQYSAVVEGGVPGKGRRGRAKVIPSVIDKNVSAATSAILRVDPKPDMILIDHVFNINNPQRWKGSTIAHVLRERWSDIPMVCVTSMLDTPKAFNQEDLSEYVAVFQYPRLLDDHLEDLYAIAQDFPRLAIPGKQVRDRLVSVLKAPKPEEETLKRVLPAEFHGQTPQTTQHRIAYWIFNFLLERPGFLYNRLRTATLLGLSETGFSKVEKLFERALYTGPFHTTKRPLWWTNELTRLLYKNLPAEAPDLPQFAGRTLNRIVKTDFSKSYIGKGTEIADVVAKVDAASDKEVPVASKYTAPHPDELQVPAGFESLLVISKTRKK